MDQSVPLQIFAAAVLLSMLWILESAIPFLSDRRRRLQHGLRNILIGTFNSVVLWLSLTTFLIAVTGWSAGREFGLLHLFELPVFVSGFAAILLLDLWMYIWHRANHRIPMLWRFHKVHHSDSEMDVSTAVRFHTGEVLISAVLRLGVIAVLGLSLWHLLLYDVLLVPVIFLHHSNVRISETWDKLYRSVFASPSMHRVHHSPLRIEADSNYGSIFSFWDRIARSYMQFDYQRETRYGLSEFTAVETERLWLLALMPFRRTALDSSKTRKLKSGA
jgi:sterol desaturase/sphingolipid hydroxylase (fatty acid hydroxylase superfamily)